MSFFAGIDAGTSGATVIIAQANGTLRGIGSSQYKFTTPSLGRVEQDMGDVWRGVAQASQIALKASGIAASDICSISIASQRGSFVAVDADWEPLGPALVWSDRRAEREMDILGKEIGADRFRSLTGLPLSSIWSCVKIKWLVENQPEIFRKTALFLNAQEWLLHRLGADKACTDPASITMNGMMDISRLDWSDEVLALIGIDRNRLPPVMPSMTQVGRVNRAGAAATGFAEGTPLFLGGGDQQCAAMGSGTISPGRIVLTLGTGAVALSRIDEIPARPLRAALIGGHVVPGARDIEGIALSAGNCFRWWSRVAWGNVPEKGAKHSSIYEAMDKEAQEVPIGSRGLLFFPYFFGHIIPKPELGAFAGLSNEHARPEMTRAILEGVAFELRVIVDELREQIGAEVALPIRIDGGGSRSPLWLSILANVFNTPLELLSIDECTAYGAALLGAVGAGAFPDQESASRSLVRISRTVYPEPEAQAAYSRAFKAFTEHRLSGAQA